VDEPSLRRPNPVRLYRTLRVHEVDLHRRIACRRYDECLDRSVRSCWLSFTCVRCFAFRPRRLDTVDWTLDDLAHWLAEGRANRMFQDIDAWLVRRRAGDRSQV